ncbi:uncharacterized protein G2W53_022377 [Senna tora]|uniref:Uncharacterized protein n=1 Tax=Senna tora TaxID=362788 RepID=A0A834TL45_9FABA|nr:uncharacterized protein G2W53_022377 [Senna tora]
MFQILFYPRKWHYKLPSKHNTHLSGTRAEAVIPTLGFKSFVRVHSMGFTGAIWLLWHPQSIHVAPIGSTIQELHCIIKIIPWLLFGDFIDYSKTSKKFGGRPLKHK